MGISQQTCQFFLEMIGLTRIEIYVMFNTDLGYLNILLYTSRLVYALLTCRMII